MIGAVASKGHLLVVPVLFIPLVLGACSDPTEAERSFQATISGPEVVNADISHFDNYDTYECRFELTVRGSGGAPDDSAWLNAPKAELRLSDGRTQGYSMLDGWESRQISAGEEVRGQFYLDAVGAFEATLTSSWVIDLQAPDASGNTITLKCR